MLLPDLDYVVQERLCVSQKHILGSLLDLDHQHHAEVFRPQWSRR